MSPRKPIPPLLHQFSSSQDFTPGNFCHSLLNHQWLALCWALQFANQCVIYEHTHTHLLLALFPHQLLLYSVAVDTPIYNKSPKTNCLYCLQIFSHSLWGPIQAGFASFSHSHDTVLSRLLTQGWLSGCWIQWSFAWTRAAFQEVGHSYLIDVFLYLDSRTLWDWLVSVQMIPKFISLA